MKLLHLLLFCSALAAPAPAAVLMQAPGGYYRSANDSPYFAQLQNNEAFLNDFSGDQDGYYWTNQAGQLVYREYALTQRRIVDSTGWEFAQRIFNAAQGPGAENVSVDADDGRLGDWATGRLDGWTAGRLERGWRHSAGHRLTPGSNRRSIRPCFRADLFHCGLRLSSSS